MGGRSVWYPRHISEKANPILANVTWYCKLKLKNCGHHLLYTNLISSFAARKCQKIQNVDKKCYYWWRKLSYLLNDMMNFNEMFRKNVTYGIIKSNKKSRLCPLPRKHNLGKIAEEGSNWRTPDILGLIRH